MGNTDTRVEDIIKEINRIKDLTQKSDIKQSTKDALLQNSSVIQSLLNTYLEKTGALTPEQLNEIDEKLKKQKFDLLKAQADRTRKTIIISVVSFVGLIGLLFYLTRKKD